MTELDEFLEERLKIPIPSGDVARIKLLAMELALGFHRRVWRTPLTIQAYGRYEPNHPDVDNYFAKRWCEADFGHMYELLTFHGFANAHGALTTNAFNLLYETEPYNIFISYKRSESSMLALLVSNTLKLNGFNPFFDMQLKPTEEWHALLEQRIKDSNYFVVLLGPETHCSKYTVREIHWAMIHEIPIVQVWQHGFAFGASDWSNVEYPAVVKKLELEQAVVPIADNAEGYHLALEKMLNRFGITP